MKHGMTGYTVGCRCQVCVQTHRAYQRERHRQVREGERQERFHGAGGYARGCRCDTCREGSAAYQRQRRADIIAGVKPVRHGTVTSYSLTECRCVLCVAAYRRSYEKVVKRKAARRRLTP